MNDKYQVHAYRQTAWPHGRPEMKYWKEFEGMEDAKKEARFIAKGNPNFDGAFVFRGARVVYFHGGDYEVWYEGKEKKL